ncbi:AbrB/MazE/SpoVT family DNA-binding domain-containing protein [Oceanidesulfovibrio indonesiensis]|uniref:AbrB/MazE/SpoVT family DNA-binding domain-containing protein n=1 Tax=Oceanidesulfovibrio indonesiensis TaxID=54767 RepID=A0A7M3MJK3_9BACT|nr:AbrB/MazE/SpoVT family DNA-binding domain-containing protein [Oceanidesulfovibrio indonesiensis]TVM19997.1 AbrB/MazE/SpoVT family DNA-binding domain-containing protein [Oceanidesulfovibrio indonesiensis]
MSTDTTIARWGNSLGLRIPKGTADTLGLKAGDAVRIEVSEDGLYLKKVQKTPKYTLNELLDQVTEENKHDAVDWGTPKGREIL